MKKFSFIIIVLTALLLSACAGENSADTGGSAAVPKPAALYTVRQMAEVAAVSQPENPPFRFLSPEDDYFNEYVTDFYGLDTAQIKDGAVFYAGGMLAAEIAVLKMDSADNAAAARDLLEEYITRRAGAFSGYAPVETAMLENSEAVSSGEYVALLICGEPDEAETDFLSCFTDEPAELSPTGAVALVETEAAGDSAEAELSDAASVSESSHEASETEAVENESVNGPADTPLTGANADVASNNARVPEEISEADFSRELSETDSPTGLSSVEISEAEASTNSGALDTPLPSTDASVSDVPSLSADASVSNDPSPLTDASVSDLPSLSAAASASSAPSPSSSASNAPLPSVASATDDPPLPSDASISNTPPPSTDASVSNTPSPSTEASASGATLSPVNTSVLAPPPVSLASDVYDRATVLLAYQTGDESGLTEKNKAILQKCKEIISEVITESMDEYEKEKAIHDYIAERVDYDDAVHDQGPDSIPDPDNGNPYGALINHKAICYGFAETFQLLTQMLGFECIVIRGDSTGGEHAWNMIVVEGKWYCVDVTWDRTGAGGFNYNYFNQSSAYFLSTGHIWEQTSGMPLAGEMEQLLR